MVNNKCQQLQDRSILPSFFPLAVRSLLFWSLEHVYSWPAALSALHRFCHLSVLSNARDQYFSESSLPNVQGVVCLSTPCSQPAVLHFYTRPFATVFTNSRLKTASPVSIGLHTVLRIFGTHVKVVVNRLFFWCRHREIVVHVFLNVIDHVYAILKQCYLFHRLSMPCPTLLHIVNKKNFFLRHDLKALMQKLIKKDFFSPKNCLHTVAFNCFCSPSLPRRDSPCSASCRFRLGRWKPSSCLTCFPCLDSEENAKPPVVCHAGIGHVGGGSHCGISWTSIERFVKSTPEIFDKRSMLLYHICCPC